MKRKTLREEYSLLRNEFMLPREVLSLVEEKNLRVVLDLQPRVKDAFGTWIRVTFPDSIAANPTRFKVYTHEQDLKADLVMRNLYVAVSSGGFIKVRNLPAGATVDWESGAVTTPTGA